MKFWQVAVAIIMFKMLELFWSWAWLSMTNGFQLGPVFVATIGWAAISAALWFGARALASSASERTIAGGRD